MAKTHVSKSNVTSFQLQNQGDCPLRKKDNKSLTLCGQPSFLFVRLWDTELDDPDLSRMLFTKNGEENLGTEGSALTFPLH